jgi:hypothetical protein
MKNIAAKMVARRAERCDEGPLGEPNLAAPAVEMAVGEEAAAVPLRELKPEELALLTRLDEVARPVVAPVAVVVVPVSVPVPVPLPVPVCVACVVGLVWVVGVV